MNHKIKIITLIILSSPFIQLPIHAQTTQKINLQQAIDLSVKNSNNLKIADSKVLLASADLQEAKDSKLPNATVSASYLRLSSANIDLKSAQNNNRPSPKVNQAVYGIANVNMPLYSGGRIKYGIESAKYLEKAAKLNVENDKESVVYNTIQSYTNLYKSFKSVAVIKENLNASVQRDSLFSRLEQNGILARNDLLKAQLTTSNIELSLLDAQNNFTTANINMALLLGLPENTFIEVDSSFVNITQQLKPFIEMENMALQNRKDVQVIAFQKKAAAVGVKVAKAEVYPTIALTGGYIAADIPKLITVTNAINIGLGVQYNIASLWKNNTKLTQARAKEVQLNATESLLNDGIKLQLNRDYQNYLFAQKKIDVYEKSIAQATENYRITKNKYDNNLVTITELLEADVSLLQAKLNASVSKADAALAYNKILSTTGTLSK
jgi:outer membrane protein TolC